MINIWFKGVKLASDKIIEGSGIHFVDDIVFIYDDKDKMWIQVDSNSITYQVNFKGEK